MANKWYLRETTDLLKDISVKKLDKFGDILQEECQEGAPGRIKVVKRVNRIRQQVTVAATHPENNLVPFWVEYGTAPHEITPVTAQVLHFIAKDGTEVFTKHVNHPGTSPNPFMRRGISRAVFRVQELRF
jgi:hypothetical protein